MLRQTCLALTLLLIGQQVIADELTPAKQAAIRKFIESTDGKGMTKVFVGMVSQGYYRALKAQKPAAPERVVSIVEQAITPLLEKKVTEKGGLIDRLVPIYAKRFTLAEVQQLQKFIDSPIGQKYTKSSHDMAMEGMQLRQQWALSMGPEINQHIEAALKKENIEPLPTPEAKPVVPLAPTTP